MMATGGSEFSSDEVSDSQCFTCDNKSAVKFCVECQGYLCKTCAHSHSRIPVTKEHTLLGKNDTTNFPGQAAELPEMPTQRCNIHTVKLVDMYCKDHDEVGCTTCIALNHRSCTNVHSIPDDINMLYRATDIEDTNRYLQNLEIRVESIVMKKKVVLTALNSSRKKADMSIDNAKRVIVTHVENLADQAKEEVEKKFLTAKTQVEKEKNEANEIIDDLKKMSTELSISEGNKSQQFVCLKIAKRNIKKVDEIEQTSQYNEVANISFDVESSIQTFSRDVKKLGRVSCRMGTKLYAVEAIRDINVKLKNDKSTCYIYGSCLTEDGRSLLTDYNNKSLKSVNIETLNVESVCSFDSNPFCVCCTKRDEAVVTFYRSPKFIQFVSIGTLLMPSRKVDINHDCLGISYKDDKLYITDNDQTLYIHDMTGNELQKISNDSTANGLFREIKNIFLSESMRGSVIADWSKGVIILNDHYQRIAEYCDTGLQCATSVCTDGRRTIFVCGWTSHNVIQIGYDGKKIGDVVDKSNGIQYPTSLCFDSTTSRLIVAQESDIVKIIQLK